MARGQSRRPSHNRHRGGYNKWTYLQMLENSSYYGGASPVPEPLGELFNQDFATIGSLSDYTIVNPGGGTVGLSGGFLRAVYSPGPGTFANYIQYNGYGSTNLEEYTLETIITPRTFTVNSYGIGLGLVKTQLSNIVESYGGFLQMNNGVDKGKIQITYGTGPAFYAAGATKLLFSVDDRIKITFTRSKLHYTFTAENLTVPHTVSVTYDSVTAYGNINLTANPISKPAIFFAGGTIDVEYLTANSPAQKNIDILFYGDSITAQYGVPTLPDRYADKVMSGSLKSYTVCASPGGTTEDFLQCLNEIVLLNPDYLFFECGINDLAYSSIAAAKIAFQSIIAGKASRTKIIQSYIVPYQTNDPAAWNTMIDQIAVRPPVDFTTALGTGTPKLPDPTFYNADLVHPNDTGSTEQANKFILQYSSIL